MKEKQYIAIDLKSFYASVECQERGLDPLTARLVVADTSRTDKTICLAVSPALKAYGISGRARLFEVEQRIRQIKSETGKEIDYIAAPPRMQKYMEYSSMIYRIYLKYIAPEDIHVYSIDEVFMDVTSYLSTYKMTARELAMTMIRDVLSQTGITATAGIGTNLYLCKVAMDIVAKHVPADKDGVRIAELDEMSYKEQLWEHRPLTDFWRVGSGYARKLESHGIFTMGDVARCALANEDILYDMFGVNAELLIDHAFGIEPSTIPDIKAYKPVNNSLSSGQVLMCPYDYDKAYLIVKEMTDQLFLDMTEKGLVTDQLGLAIGYDISNLTDPDISRKYKGNVVMDYMGRLVPEHARGSVNLPSYRSSTREIMDAMGGLYERIVNRDLLIRRVNISANRVISEAAAMELEQNEFVQLSLFDNIPEMMDEKDKLRKERDKDMKARQAVVSIRQKYGKNAILKGMDLQEGAQTINRNSQIGGHKA
ncbi:Y-family DNA polymerase [Butyrivibrio sp. MC2013]|uniref:Y-family DNA polymerase n=1 Tax=Butyrivibrio sp. MC2013 TaxID=1280686 RepID=UPI0003FAA134|nr:DNA methylase [Butyrivibrio sp. MC2013]